MAIKVSIFLDSGTAFPKDWAFSSLNTSESWAWLYRAPEIVCGRRKGVLLSSTYGYQFQWGIYTHIYIIPFGSDIARISLDPLLLLPSIISLSIHFLVLSIFGHLLLQLRCGSVTASPPAPTSTPVAPSSAGADRAVRLCLHPRSAAWEQGGHVSTSLQPGRTQVSQLLLRIPTKQWLFCLGLGPTECALLSCLHPPWALQKQLYHPLLSLLPAFSSNPLSPQRWSVLS